MGNMNLMDNMSRQLGPSQDFDKVLFSLMFYCFSLLAQ